MDQVQDYLKRPKQYFNIDGVGELGAGAFSLGVGLVLLADARTPESSFWHKISLAVFLALIGVVHFGTKAVKERITFPRTGYVEYRKRERRITSVVAAVIAPLFLLALTLSFRRRWDISTPAALGGLVFAGVYAYHFTRMFRWKWLVAGAIAIGSLVIATLPADTLAAVVRDSLSAHPVQAKFWAVYVLSFVVYGAMILFSGAISFWLYLRNTQPPGDESR